MTAEMTLYSGYEQLLQENRQSSRSIIIIISNLTNDRSKASCKTIPPHSAI